MTIQDLKIKDFEHIEYIAPNASSGTGYCEYETIKVIYENDLTQIVTIPNWYISASEQVKQLKENIKTLAALYMACGLNETNLIFDIEHQ